MYVNEKINNQLIICINWEASLRKSVRIRSISGPYFHAFGLNTERYAVSFRIKSKCPENIDPKNAKCGHFLHSAFQKKKKKKSEGFQLFTWFLMQLPKTISNPFMNFLASFHGMFALIHDVQIEIIPLITCICNTVYGKFHKHLLRMYLIAFIKAYYKCNFKFDQLAFLISCICNTLYNFRNNLSHIYLRSIAKSYYNKI